MLLHNHLVNDAKDLCFITETWLRNNDEDRAWLNCSVIYNNSYKTITSNRVDTIGRGIALIYKDSIKVTEIKTEQLHSFQYGKWRAEIQHNPIILIRIYWPPYTNMNMITTGTFIEEFTEWIGEHLVNDRNLVITGDFSVHINDQDDPDAHVFRDTTSALGLNQHITFSMHRAGNTLDLLFTKTSNNVNVLQCKKGPTLHDHDTVISTLSATKLCLSKRTISYHKLENINTDEMITSMNLASLEFITDLEDIVSFSTTTYGKH